MPAFLFLCICTRASAAPLSAPTLHWARGPRTEVCIDPRALSERVEDLLGASLVRGAEAEHTIEGRVERSANGFRAELRSWGRKEGQLGERTLQSAGSDCTALSAPLAFIIAMMIDPEVLAHGLPPELLALLGEAAPEQALLTELSRKPPMQPAAPPPVEAKPGALPKEGSQPSAQAAPPERFHLALAPSAALLPALRPTLAGRALLLARARSWLGVGASAWAGGQLRSQRVDATRSFRVWPVSAEALLCASSPEARRLRITGCVGPALQLRHARGDGFGRDLRSTLVSGSAAALLELRVHIFGRFGLSALAGADLGFSRQRLVAEQADHTRQTLHRFAPASFSAGLGPTFDF